MKVKITEYESTGKAHWIMAPTKIIRTWIENTPVSTSGFWIADYIAAKYPNKVLGTIII